MSGGLLYVRRTMESIHSLRSAWPACFLLLLILPLWFSFLARVDAVKVNQTDEVGVLFDFINQNSFERVMTWNGSDHNPCAWDGVSCTINDTVEELDISGWGAVLFLKPLTALKDLRRLDVSSNWVVVLPNGTQLTWVDASGTIVISSSLPGFLASNLNLRYLDLEQTGLGPGQLSRFSNIRDLVNLQFLNLAGNSLNGTFSTEELGGLRSLVRLDLSRNAFSGTIPSFPNLTSLVELKLDDNNFTGFEEPWFLGTNRLQYLSVSNNKLEGSIPSTIADFGNLTVLNMSGNYLMGKIPSQIVANIAMKSGYSLYLSHNQLTGAIPPDKLLNSPPSNYFCGSLNLLYNLLTGNLPVGSQNVCFSALDFAYNNLSGSIPSNIFKNYSVGSLSLGNNNLSGDIVDVLATLKEVSEVRLENNLFTGDLSRILNIPTFTLLSSYLQAIDLSNNHLQWSVSEAIPDPISATLKFITKPSLLFREFRVGGNNFSGTPLPTECFLNHDFSYAFFALDLSNSQLEGEIFGPAFDHTCLPNINFLNLSNNHANGPLPESIVADRPRSPDFVVDVSNNNLSGTFPAISQSSNLYNPKYFAGNAGLCGGPLAPCSQRAQWWVLLIRWIKKEKLYILVGGFAILGTGCCLFATWQWKVYKKRHQQDADLIKTLLERESATLMPLRELKKATQNFAESAQIGEGGYGTVYIGKLDNGTMVAVKRSKQGGLEKHKEQFLNEVRILSQIKHRNLVKLLGCCMENKIAVLVFEFISNGTLQEHLQGTFGAVPLSWKQRVNIATQTADALHYLHSTTIFPIYHRDVKSANTLLDDDLNAKVADFGISKLAPLRATHVSTVAVQGTIGYIDPEYYTSYQLTDRSDVYNFGVVLLELISARPALDFHRSGDETSLVFFAGPYIARGELQGLIDPTIMDTYSDEVGHGRESILTVAKLAMKCLEMRSRARPSMYEVLKELQKLWGLDGTSNDMQYPTHEDDDLQRDLNGVLRLDLWCKESYSSAIESDASGIQMLQLSRPERFRSRTLER